MANTASTTLDRRIATDLLVACKVTPAQHKIKYRELAEAKNSTSSTKILHRALQSADPSRTTPLDHRNTSTKMAVQPQQARIARNAIAQWPNRPNLAAKSEHLPYHSSTSQKESLRKTAQWKALIVAVIQKNVNQLNRQATSRSTRWSLTQTRRQLARKKTLWHQLCQIRNRWQLRWASRLTKSMPLFATQTPKKQIQLAKSRLTLTELGRKT